MRARIRPGRGGHTRAKADARRSGSRGGGSSCTRAREWCQPRGSGRRGWRRQRAPERVTGSCAQGHSEVSETGACSPRARTQSSAEHTSATDGRTHKYSERTTVNTASASTAALWNVCSSSQQRVHIDHVQSGDAPRRKSQPPQRRAGGDTRRTNLEYSATRASQAPGSLCPASCAARTLAVQPRPQRSRALWFRQRPSRSQVAVVEVNGESGRGGERAARRRRRGWTRSECTRASEWMQVSVVVLTKLAGLLSTGDALWRAESEGGDGRLSGLPVEIGAAKRIRGSARRLGRSPAPGPRGQPTAARTGSTRSRRVKRGERTRSQITVLHDAVMHDTVMRRMAGFHCG